MLHTFVSKYENTIIIGEASEIKAVFNSMARAWKFDKYSIRPFYKKKPVLEQGRMYGIVIEDDGWAETFKIINADVALRSLVYHISKDVPECNGIGGYAFEE